MQLPVKVHLENPFLGSSCYIGSNSSPIIWNLTSGETTPPAGVTPLIGKPGFPEVVESGEIALLTENELVENDWEAPGATGCGEPFSAAIDLLLNVDLGLPASSGVSSAHLENDIAIATPTSVNAH